MTAVRETTRQAESTTDSPRNAALTASWGALVPPALVLGALGLYLLTAARTITWANGGADGAELSAAAWVLGIAHPPGYPLYLLLGRAFATLPVGEVAFRVTLLSVLSAALAVGLTGAAARRLCAGDRFRSSLAAVGAGAALAPAPIFWSQAIIPEVYALHGLIVAGALFLLVRWRPGDDRTVLGLALLFGLGLGNHLTLLFLAGPTAFYLLARDHSLWCRRGGVLAACAFVLGVAIYLYLPIRAAADPAVNWGEPTDLLSMLAHISGTQYRGYLGGQPPAEVFGRASAVAGLLGQQLTWPGLFLALLGLSELAAERPAFFRLVLSYALLTLGFALVYNAADGQVYLLPVVIVLAIGVGLGAARLAAWRIPCRVGALIAIITLAGWQIWQAGPALDVSRDGEAATYARETLAAAAPRVVLMTDRDELTFALWYAQYVEGLRPDVVVVDRRLLRLGWYRAQLERRHPGLLRQLGA